MSDFISELQRWYPASAELGEACLRHFELMVKWNPKLNLTRILDVRLAARRHYAESLRLVRFLQELGSRFVDLGSGAGFPGVPVGLARPDWSVILLESDVRKNTFLKEACRGYANFSFSTLRSDRFVGDVHAVITRAVRFEDVSGLAKRLSVPALWITSAAELEKVPRGTCVAEVLEELPLNDGLIVKLDRFT